MLKGDRSFHRRWEIVLADNKTSIKKPPFYIRWFFPILVLLGVIGGVAALWIPSNTGWLRQSGLSGEAAQKSISDLRLHFLYITGGIIAILTLLQTNWKNQGDRLKIDADIKKNEQDAEKNERDHIRQVHAERRSRYTKAVEQLADEKATVRLGGIYTLVGLVDEWLTDDTLNPKERQKEGQVIINNLCSYIRSPFPLALKAEMFEGDSEPDNYEEDFSKDQAAFHEEQDVRRTIFIEMGKRSSVISNKEESDVTVTPRAWSDFDFDFSRAPIFYPLNAIAIEKGNFSSAKFYSNADFSWAVFTQNANFIGAAFTQNANFNGAAFTQNANFNGAAFTQNADFSKATFTQNANFNEATFEKYSPRFGATTHGVSGEAYRARFRFVARSENQRPHNFAVHEDSRPILLGEAELDGLKYHIPVGTVLFDPDSWSEEKQKYTRVSEPAKPLKKFRR